MWGSLKKKPLLLVRTRVKKARHRSGKTIGVMETPSRNILRRGRCLNPEEIQVQLACVVSVRIPEVIRGD
jgi:hypothetical protein